MVECLLLYDVVDPQSLVCPRFMPQTQLSNDRSGEPPLVPAVSGVHPQTSLFLALDVDLAGKTWQIGRFTKPCVLPPACSKLPLQDLRQYGHGIPVPPRSPLAGAHPVHGDSAAPRRGVRGPLPVGRSSDGGHGLGRDRTSRPAPVVALGTACAEVGMRQYEE